MLNRDQGTAYSECVPPRRNRRDVRQHTVAVDDQLWNDCVAIAAEKRETVSAVLRARLVAYRDENRALLDEIRSRPPQGDDTATAATS